MGDHLGLPCLGTPGAVDFLANPQLPSVASTGHKVNLLGISRSFPSDRVLAGWLCLFKEGGNSNMEQLLTATDTAVTQ